MQPDEPEYKLGWHRGKLAAVWYEKGKRKRASMGTTVLSEARSRLAHFIRQKDLEERGAPVTMAAIYQAYVADRVSDGKVTGPRMQDAWKRLAPFFGVLLPGHINQEVCRGYMKARGKAGASAGTVHIELGYLRAALRFAQRQNWIDRAPDVPLPQKPPPRHGHLSKDEAERLLEAAAFPHVRLFIRLALTTAGRAGAILDLKWSRVNFTRGTIDLRDPDRAQTPKGRALVPINSKALPELLEAKKHATTDYVIEWGGERIGSVKKAVKGAATRAKVKASPHVLRHTAAVWMAEAGIKMDEIAQFLGHGDVRTTYRVYARYSPEYLKKATDALDF